MNKLKQFYHNPKVRNPFVWDLILAFVFNLVIETLARHTMPGYGGLYFMVTRPLAFFDNVLIIYATLVVSALFRRSTFVLTLISSVWMAIGVTNGIILSQRMTPFTVKDFSSMADGATIMTNYFSKIQLFLMFGAVALLLVVFILLFIKGPKRTGNIHFKKSLITVVLIILAAFGATAGLIKTGNLATFFGNLAYAYEDYGVPYCFINTWMNTGIHRPANYSKKAVQSVLPKKDLNKNGTVKFEKDNSANTKNKPNILFLQLESFVDPKLFTNIKYSQDPIPYYRSLMKNYSSGNLTVPACGAGTANTEFEVMTGLSIKFFGPGEYPFKSVLKDETAESIAWDLRDIGYSSHAIHDHRAMFYNRNTVFNNIGYNTFTSVEYMPNVEKTPKGWEKDKILTSQIMGALKSTKNRDYIYTISVQGHGKYPSEKVLTNPKIKVTKAPNEELKNKYEYYVNQVYEMDQFVKQLTNTLSKYKEPTILVMYGDHIPALEVTSDNYALPSLYQTQYVVWSNYKMKRVHKNMHAYQLAAYIFNRLGIHNGTTIEYHQQVNHHSKNYLKNLKLLGYDMLYGKRYIYGGKKFPKGGMKMGVKTIKVNKVVEVSGKYYIQGENFTEQSKITLHGKTLSTKYLTPQLLVLKKKVDPSEAKYMKVSQVDKSDNTIISTTE